MHLHGALHGPPSTAFCERNFKIACYTAKQIQRAFNLGPLYAHGTTGKGQTIVIVDSFGSPTIVHDLHHFDATYHLPNPTLKVIQPAGAFTWKANDTEEGWAGETTLDVEYAHTIAPQAKILLVETPVSEEEGRTGFPQIIKAEKYVINHDLGGVISQSFSATEETFPTAQALLRLRSAYVDAAAHQVTVLTATGDSGAADVRFNESDYYLHPVTSWPDSDPLVTGVGGTQLKLDAKGQHTAKDVVWNDSYNTATNEFIFGEAAPGPGRGRRRQIGDLRSADVSGRRTVGGRQTPWGTGHLDERRLQRCRQHLSELPGTERGLVPDVRDERGHSAVRWHRRAGRRGRGPPDRPDQSGAVRAAGAPRSRHR